MRTEDSTQRGVEQVSRRVIASRRVAHVHCNLRGDQVPWLQRPTDDVDRMEARPGANLDDAGDRRFTPGALDRPDIRDLTTGLEIERRLGQHDETAVADAER